MCQADAMQAGGILKILLSEQQLRGGVARLADEINAQYRGQPLTMIGVLTGSVVLLADLIRQLTMPLRVGVIQARSYRGSATSPGDLTIQADLLPDIRGRQVLVVDDIFDTGQTLLELAGQLGTLEPSSLRLAVLLRKRDGSASTSNRITSASRFRTSSSWATGWTIATSIGTCPTSARGRGVVGRAGNVSSLRVVLVSRSFWPLTGGPEVMLGRLAVGLHSQGASRDRSDCLLAARLAATFEDRGVHVVRLPPPVGRRWATLAYIARLASWLREHHCEFDLVYVSELKHEAYAAIFASRAPGFPVVLRAEHAGLAGDCHWQLTAALWSADQTRCQRAAAIVAPSAAVQRELVAAGYPATDCTPSPTACRFQLPGRPEIRPRLVPPWPRPTRIPRWQARARWWSTSGGSGPRPRGCST